MARSRILIVEDDGEMALSLARPLQAKGYRVTVANGASAAVDFAKGDRPGLVLLDMEIRDGSAYRVMERFRLFPELAEVPMVAMTAWRKVRQKQRDLRAGISLFIEKPIDQDDLVSTVVSVLSRTSQTA